MNVEMVARSIQIILAPAVMVTACAILTGALHARYAAIDDRLQAMLRERLDILGMWNQGQPAVAAQHILLEERLAEVDRQLPDLLRRHWLARNAALALYCALMGYVASMFVIATAVSRQSASIASMALVVFLSATGLFLLALLFMACEIRTSHRALQIDVRRVLRIQRDLQLVPVAREQR